MVLARFALSEETAAVVRRFHAGGLACVRMTVSQPSEWFDVTQGLWLGYVLSPLLLNFVFAAVMHATLVRFSGEDPDGVRGLEHLEDLEKDGV